MFKRLLWAVASGLLFSACRSGQPPSAHIRPNIILILADDLGYGDLGCYGQQLIRTPNLDSLAAGGMRFTQFYAGCPVCAPSRSVLMTGLHSGHTPVRGNKTIPPEGQWPLPDTVTTLSSLLQKAGYRTGAFGKWGLGAVGSEGDPVRRGFDVFFGYNDQGRAHNYYPDHLWWNDTRIPYPNTPQQPLVYAADLIQDSALAFIQRNRDHPFFVWCTYTLPHAALQVPEDSLFTQYRERFAEQAQPVKPWEGRGYAPQAYPRAAYAAMVTRLDRYVGQIVRALKTWGLDSNTLVLFTSDNGPHHEGGHDPAFFRSAGGLRGVKRDVYEGGIRVPLIAWWPGRVPPGRVSHFMGAFWDLLPTCMELSGAPPPRQGLDGFSFLPALLGDSLHQARHDYLYWEFHEQGGKQALRMGRWKGVRLQVSGHPDAALALYDLTDDPQETRNVSASRPDVVKKMQALMQQAHVENPVWPFWP